MPPKKYTTIAELLNDADPAQRPLLEYLHELIAGISPYLEGHIKWNSIAFQYTGPMPPFDPKEYKRDVVVFNARPGKPLLLVFPAGNHIPVSPALGDQNLPDGRKMVTLASLDDAHSKSTELVNIIQQWLPKG